MVNQEYCKALDRDTLEQFRGKPNLKILHDALARQLQEVYDCLTQLNKQRDLYTAVGAQLDGIGDIAVLTRMEAGLLAGNPIPFDVIDDETYRQYLIWKVLKNTTDCTYPDIIKAFRMFWDKPLYYTEDPAEPATMIFDTGWMTNKDADTRPLFRTPLLRAGGVTLKLYARTLQEMPPVLLHMRGRHFSVTQTQMPELEIVYPFDDVIDFSSAAGQISQTQMSELEIVYPFNDVIDFSSAAEQISQSQMPGLEERYELAAKIKPAGMALSIMQTPIPPKT